MIEKKKKRNERTEYDETEECDERRINFLKKKEEERGEICIENLLRRKKNSNRRLTRSREREWKKNKWSRLKTDKQSIFVLNRILFTLSRGSPFHRYLPA